MRFRAWGAVVAAIAAAALALPVLTAPTASAHAGEEALLVEPHATWPGGTVMVRGDLPVTSDVHLLLVDSAGRMTQVGRVDDPPSGHFEVPVTVPASTRAGAWSIVAVVGGDPVGQVALTVGAAPPAAGERADQAEPMLPPGARAAPAPAAQPPSSGGYAAAAEVVRAPASTAPPQPPSGPTAGAWILAGALVASVTVGLTAYLIVRPRRLRARPF
ncbi:hypothetical protein ACWEOW_10260 [Monashia sp. NPDC004114]